LDCMHEIWDGLCTSCGRRYPGHEGREDWPDYELGWMGLEEGEGDDEDDGLAIGDWYPGLPVFSWGVGFDEEDGDEDEDDEGDDEAYESDFIDDEHDIGIPPGPIRRLPHIRELSDDSDNEDSRSRVDADLLSEDDEEDQPSLASRLGRTAPIVVSSDEDEDEDEPDSVFALRPSRSRRGRLVESDDDVDVLGSSDGSSQ